MKEKWILIEGLKNFQFFSGKSILDYGCGDGDFLKKTQDFAKSISGVELQIDYVNNLKNIGISCFNDIDNVKENSIDTCFSFHVLEHLLDPIETLHKINNKLVENGIVIIEFLRK